MVDTILSDKTGTLTCNMMEFFKASIAGVSYGQGVTEIEKANARRSGSFHVTTPSMIPSLILTVASVCMLQRRLFCRMFSHLPGASCCLLRPAPLFPAPLGLMPCSAPCMVSARGQPHVVQSYKTLCK